MITSRMFGRSPAAAAEAPSRSVPRLQPGAPRTVSPAAPALPATSSSRRLIPARSSIAGKLARGGSGRHGSLASHGQLVGPQALAALQPPVEDGHVHVQALELERRPRNGGARATAREVLPREPQLQAGASL